jgi:hypothetical protein
VLEQFQWEKSAEMKLMEKAQAKKLEEQEEAFSTREAHLKRVYQVHAGEALQGLMSPPCIPL